MSELALPKIDKSTILNKNKIVSNLKKIIKSENVLDHNDEIKPYETDALSAYKQKPLVVVLPENVQEVSKILKYCNEEKIKVIPRGAGTGLSGGALPLQDAILLGLGKFNKILEIDFNNKCVVSQPGVTNLAITHAVQHKGFYYAPDPSSQLACSIGGNVAENSGGIHSLKYGTTTNNILAPATPSAMKAFVDIMPEGSHWSGFAISKMEMPYVAQTVLLGGNVRVGLEDNIYLKKGVLASNAQLVEKAIRIITDMGATTLTPEETRQKLKVKKHK